VVGIRKILLFDIDGTLLRPESSLTKLHHATFIYVFKNVWNTDIALPELISYGGYTDTQIITEVLINRGFKESEISARMSDTLKAMVEYYRSNLDATDKSGCLIDGVADVLNQLNRSGAYIMGIVSGNIREIARMNLSEIMIQ